MFFLGNGGGSGAQDLFFRDFRAYCWRVEMKGFGGLAVSVRGYME